MRPALLLSLAALLLAAAPAWGATKRFQTPSRNIACLYSSSGGPSPFLRCDVLSLNDTGFTLDRRGRGKRVRVTDSVVGRARTLRYGRSLALGPFRCRSRRAGLTCRSSAGHGFFLSRERQRTF